MWWVALGTSWAEIRMTEMSSLGNNKLISSHTNDCESVKTSQSREGEPNQRIGGGLVEYFAKSNVQAPIKFAKSEGKSLLLTREALLDDM